MDTLDDMLKTIGEIPIVGWIWLLIDERTGDEYDCGFSWGKEKPDMDRYARDGTHYDYAALIGRNRLFRELGVTVYDKI